MKRLLLPLVMLLSPGLLIAQLDAPVLLCDSVGVDGSVTLHWEQVADPGNIFTAYTIYYRPNTTAVFSQVGTISDITQLSYTHTTADAATRSRYYYLVVESTLGPSLASDTLETIFLYYETTDNENVTLYWNAKHDPPFPSPDVQYQVFAEYPPGNWQLVTVTQQLTANYHFWYCNEQLDVINFRVITLDNSVPCDSYSNITSAILTNLSRPDPPLMDSVSITPTGEVLIGWSSANAPDIEGYIVYRHTTINDSIDFVQGIGNTSYIDTNVDPCSGPVTYAIASIDSCGNTSEGTYWTPHSTIYLRDISYDPCLLVNGLSWSPYKNFDPPLGGYDIFVSTDGGPYTLLTTVNFYDTMYSHSSLAPNTYYSYYIRAFNQNRGKTSTSCVKGIRTYNSPVPQFMYLRYATVDDQQEVGLSFYADTSAHVKLYKIYRGEGPASSYTEIGTIQPSATDIYFFTDNTAAVQEKSYYYTFSVIDSCDNEHVSSNFSRSILLGVQANDDLTNALSWNEYETWDGAVAGYNIYRRIGANGIEQLIGNTLPGELSYTDDISTLGNSGSRISYYVEAYEGQGNTYGFEDQARSNEVIAAVKARVFMPNAFMPNGLNNTLKPVGSFISEDNYTFSIYNRWGQLLFETANPTDSWDGTYNGKYVPQDVYVYLIQFTTSTGDLLIRKGTVAVIF